MTLGQTGKPADAARSVKNTIFRYGKVGILADDCIDATMRAAREIYGADDLPPWWFHCESAAEAAQAIRAVQETVDPAGALRRCHTAADACVRVPVVVVVDRYLKPEVESRRPVRWDESELPPCIALKDASEPLWNADGKGNRFFAAITSVSDHESARAGGPHWTPRHREPLFQLRQQIRHLANPAPSLLRFGPRDDAPAASDVPVLDSEGLKGLELEQARWTARTWTVLLGKLASDLRRDTAACPCVLFTGAGASLASPRWSAGMPPTSALLDMACQHLIARRPELAEPPSDASQGGVRQARTVHDLLALSASGQDLADVSWEMTELFHQPYYQGAKANDLRDFRDALRVVMQRYDRGFPYHLWLLVQLPWTRIVTTNFDAYIERAAEAVAAAAGEITDVRRAVALSRPRAARGADDKDVEEGPALHKPYGDLLDPGRVSWSRGEFEDRIEEVRTCLRASFSGSKKRGWLVVLGNRVGYDVLASALAEVLSTRAGRGDVSLLWVDPQAYRYGHAIAGESGRAMPSRFEDEVRRRAGDTNAELHRGGFLPGGPVPSRALDFSYDLHAEYARLAPRSGR